MKCLKQEITDFISSNISETIPNWDSSTTYTFESGTLTNASLVRHGVYIYRSLTADNQNFNPTEYENIKWIKYGVSNRYALLDMRSLTKTISSGNIVVEFNVSSLTDMVVIGNYSGEYIVVESYDKEDNLIYTYQTESTINELVEDYFSYIYEDYGVEVDRAVKLDIPPIISSKVKITLYAVEGQSSIGYLVSGSSLDMGCTLDRVKFGFNSYAVKEFDDFGSINIVKRNVQDVVDFETIVDSKDMVSYKKRLKKIYNDIVVFILDENDDSNYENLITLGTIENANVLLTNNGKTTFTWSVVEAIS